MRSFGSVLCMSCLFLAAGSSWTWSFRSVTLAQTRVNYQRQLSNSPDIVKVEHSVCKGSGDSQIIPGLKIPVIDTATGLQKSDEQGNLLWTQYNCDGLLYFKFTLADGSTRGFYGVPTSTEPATNTLVTWTLAPINQSRPQ